MSGHLQSELDDLQALQHRIKVDGEAADSGMWLDTYSSRGRQYVRLRAEKPIFDSKFTMGLGRIGSPEHRDWQSKIKRRNALQEIERRRVVIQSWLDSPIWDPEENGPTIPDGMLLVQKGVKYDFLEDKDGTRYALNKETGKVRKLDKSA